MTKAPVFTITPQILQTIRKSSSSIYNLSVYNLICLKLNLFKTVRYIYISYSAIVLFCLSCRRKTQSTGHPRQPTLTHFMESREDPGHPMRSVVKWKQCCRLIQGSFQSMYATHTVMFHVDVATILTMHHQRYNTIQDPKIPSN